MDQIDTRTRQASSILLEFKKNLLSPPSVDIELDPRLGSSGPVSHSKSKLRHLQERTFSHWLGVSVCELGPSPKRDQMVSRTRGLARAGGAGW